MERIMKDESSAGADPAELVTVHVAASDFEAQTIAAVLRDGGVEAAVFGAALGAFGLTGSGSRLLGGVPVQVRAGDLDRAKGVLRAQTVSTGTAWMLAMRMMPREGLARAGC
jgi:hypothetical protein